MCNADGSAPSPVPVCSCGCVEGTAFAAGVCNENGCIVPSIAPTDAGAATTRLVCEGESSSAPSEPIVAPSRAEWMLVREDLPSRTSMENSFPLIIDPQACQEGHWYDSLSFGSAWVDVHRLDSGECEVWLGGEIEDPLYDGRPTQYCRFAAVCDAVTATSNGDGGPATIDSPYCTP
jgi:hypothetical protein